MAKKIDENELNTIEDLNKRFAHLKAARAGFFLEVENRARIDKVIPQLEVLIAQCNEANFLQTRKEFTELFNQVAHDAIPEIDMKSV